MQRCCISRNLLLSKKLDFRPGRSGLLILLVWGALLGFPHPAPAADPDEAQALFNSGKYAECIQVAATGIEEQVWRESWWRLKIRAELATGRYVDSLATLEAALGRFSASLRLRLLGREIYRFNDRPEQAEQMFIEAEQMIERQHWRYSDAVNRVLVGRFFLLRGADAKQVLEIFFDRAKRDRPDHVDSYLASGQLALEKHDYAMAAEAFETAAKLLPDDPAIFCDLAKAYASSDPERAKKALARALELNPDHADSLLMTADRLIDAERYEQAEEVLGKVLAVNPAHPAACALRAVLAHLEGDDSGEQSWRDAALAHWPGNPEVDHLIGRKLSQKYRFAEGAACQRRALELDPTHLPAAMQLGQDLLRLGEEEEGWRLAEEVYERDAYNVAAYNLVTLNETVGKFKTLAAGGFLVRMDAYEADIYGHSVLELLGRAKEYLAARYEVDLAEPVVVEIFPEQKDFAIRTFGMPGGEGFLGVCFGNVITLNSPASQGAAPSNWKAVLWHEFCHVVTLHKTKNKMPRWLSEGISVYEEKQKDPSWGQSMNALYRTLILEDKLVPVSGLSGAFLDPPSPLHLQFAYYEASLVVEFLMETYGLETLNGILDDLATGASIDVVLENHTGPLAELDEQFAQFAMDRAKAFASEGNWQPPELERDADLAAIVEWNEQHPDNIPGLKLLAARRVGEKQWSRAKEPLEKLLEIYPEDVEAGNAYLLLGRVYRALGETEAERAVLEKLAALDCDAVEVNFRLMELDEASENWDGFAAGAERVLAVNPLIRMAHRNLARAAEALDDPQRAIQSYRALLRMDPVDPAGAHFRLATLLYQEGNLDEARRQVLKALEEAPRYRAAHRLLLQIVDSAEIEEIPESTPSNAALPASGETHLEQEP